MAADDGIHRHAIGDPGRLTAVRDTGLLDTDAEAAFDDLAQLAGVLLSAPYAFVTLVDERRSFWKSCVGVQLSDLADRQNLVEESFCQYVVNSREPLIVGDVTTNPLTAGNPSIKSMGVAAWAGFPLWSTDGHVLGTFCVVDTQIREWTGRDVEVLRVLSMAASRELAYRQEVRRARTAIEAREESLRELALVSSRLREANRRVRHLAVHDRVVSRRLQEAMLPTLPEPDHLHVAARYFAADQADQVGGDWYDALLPPGGATTLIVGDVQGHNIAAATVMGQLRQMLRAFAWDHDDEPPSAVISRLDRAMLDLRIANMTTVIMAHIEQTEDDRKAGLRTLRWSNAGHPAPILVHPTGHVELLDAKPDPPLATLRGATRHDHTRPIPAGATLILYTDGLIETRNLDIAERQAQLVRTIEDRSHEHLERLLDGIIETMVGDEPDDDVAVLAVRFHPEDQPRPAEAGSSNT